MNTEEFYDFTNHPEKLGEETLPQTEQLTKDFPYFQGGWMLYLKNLKVTSNPDYDKVLKKVALLVPDRKQLFNFLNNYKAAGSAVQNTSSEYDLGEDKEDQSEGGSLIDKFLASKPGPVRLENVHEDNSEEPAENEVAERSVTENDELITETLAMIYFEQKKYEKALDAFKKLSLKYPEKSVYFATRIEEIEKLKNI